MANRPGVAVTNWSMPRALVIAVAVVVAGCASLNRADPADTAVAARTLPAVVAPAGEALRVVSFNVHGAGAAAIARGLRSSEHLAGADVVLLQELEVHPDDDTAARVADRLGMAYAYAPGYGLDGGGSHGVAILSRFPMSDIELIELPRYGVRFNSARRVALGVTLSVGDARVRVYAVHLDNRINPSQRIEQLAPALRAAADQPVDRVVIGGDVNTSPFCWLGHVVPVPCGLQTGRLDRAARRAGFDTPLAAVGATSVWLHMRLDAIYTRGLDAVDSGVEPAVRLSDHLPVWLVVSL